MISWRYEDIKYSEIIKYKIADLLLITWTQTLSTADTAIEDWKEKLIKRVENKIKEGESQYYY